MPYLLIQTNQDINTEKSESLMQRASKTIAELLGKSENYVMVSLQDSSNMLFAGNSDPTAFLHLKSLELPEASTADYAKTLCDMIEQELDIPPDRIFINFSSPERHMWGWNNKTF